uniref:Reverse transcriptase domain-containing protein n=1 Tax=Haemonchus contortus TaxID=6289 RepID=A0A7I4Z4F9_HAECO
MHGIGGNIETYISHQVTAVFKTRFGDNISLNLITKSLLTNAFPAATLSNSDIKFLQENNIFLPNTAINGESIKPSILIGVELFEHIVLLDSAPTRLPSGLLAQNTVFGPALFGKSDKPLNQPNEGHHMFVCPELISEIKQELRDMYELEGMGISTDEYNNDDTAYNYMDSFSKHITTENGTITAPFPLKDNIVDLENNYGVAASGLNALFKFHRAYKLQRQWYIKMLKECEDTTLLKKILDEERYQPNIITFYLPHSGVWRKEKPTPLRIVFDASSKAKGKLSLNDVMHTGESFTNKIQDILTMSRWCKILITADIQAAFTQIRITPEHRNLLRFLWLRVPNQPPSPTNIVHYRFKRLPFGTKASPSILNMAISTVLTRIGTELSKEILNNIYVDNVFLAAESSEEAIQKMELSRKLFSQIGMNLRDFISSSTEVNTMIPESIKGKAGFTKLLGVSYNTDNDRISLHIKTSPRERMTKREPVSEVHKIYDPLGLALPLSLNAKLLMREVVLMKSPWNSILPQHYVDKWNEIDTKINDTIISLPRNIGKGNEKMGKSSLWVFADASQLAIVCCAYVTHLPNHHTDGLLCAKARLAPFKRKLSIPRLELIAILISLRLAKTILHVYKGRIQSLHIVNDSKIALAWLQSSRKLSVFVSNQVDRIHKLTRQVQEFGITLNFKYIESPNNPADIATRPTDKEQFRTSDWLTGPQWLQTPEPQWPIDTPRSEAGVTSADTADAEDNSTISCASVITAKPPEHIPIVDLTRFRHYSQALRTLARAMKALAQWTLKLSAHSSRQINATVIGQFIPDHNITADEIRRCEAIVLHDETKNTNFNELQSKYKDKTLFYDENNLIRVKSRLNNAAFPRDTKEPLYVPNNSELVLLIINEIYVTNMHCGRIHVLSLLRMRFWVPKPSAKVRKIFSQCEVCKREQGLPFPRPPMAPLPRDRSVICKPFQHVGCDYIGPFTTDNNEKAYIALYTCLTTRTIHLELVDNLSASAFLDSFLRFISRRGVPTIIRSDCGTSFVLRAKVIDHLFQNTTETGHSVMSYSATKNIKWIFNPQRLPGWEEYGKDL